MKSCHFFLGQNSFVGCFWLERTAVPCPAGNEVNYPDQYDISKLPLFSFLKSQITGGGFGWGDMF